MMTIFKLSKENHKTIEIIYLDRKGKLSQRYIKVLEIEGNHLTAFCHLRKCRRTFKIDNILSAGFIKYHSKMGA